MPDLPQHKLILLLGGARSGKSKMAEQLARQMGGNVLYVATAQPADEEMAERIVAHRQQRPTSWRTVEIPLNVASCLREIDLTEVILLDCLTLLASNILLSLPEDCTQRQANDAVLAEVDGLLLLQNNQPATWIIVTNEVGMGLVPPYRLGRLYRDALGNANQRLAEAADEVFLLVAGLAWRLK